MFPYFETGGVLKLGEAAIQLVLGADPSYKAQQAGKGPQGQKPRILDQTIKRPVFAAFRAMLGIIGNSFPAIWAILPPPRSRSQVEHGEGERGHKEEKKNERY